MLNLNHHRTRQEWQIPARVLTFLMLAVVSASVLLEAAFPQPVHAATLKRSETHMGTLVTVTVITRDRRRDHERARTAMDAAFREVARVDSMLSHYREDSELSLLNREKYLENISEDLANNIKKSLFFSELTGGAFDITVQPVLELYENTFGELNRPPTEAEIEQALRKVDYRKIEWVGYGVAIGAGQKITLGGIAKGYAVDRALMVLQQHGIENALVDAGGDIGTIGRNFRRDWVVALRNPRDPGDYLTRIRITDQAVVTSGDYERYFDEEKTFHHIVDPRTGYSATELISVTVAAGDAFHADGISTSVYVLGVEEGLRMVEQMAGVEALLITRDRAVHRSSGWDELEF